MWAAPVLTGWGGGSACGLWNCASPFVPYTLRADRTVQSAAPTSTWQKRALNEICVLAQGHREGSRGQKVCRSGPRIGEQLSEANRIAQQRQRCGFKISSRKTHSPSLRPWPSTVQHPAAAESSAMQSKTIWEEESASLALPGKDRFIFGKTYARVLLGGWHWWRARVCGTERERKL